MKTQPTRRQHIDALRQELANLKAELKKARTPFMRKVILDEIRAVARQLEQLLN